MARPDVADTSWRSRAQVRAIVLGVIAAGCWVVVFSQSEMNGWWLVTLPAFWCTVVSLYLAKLLLRTSRRSTSGPDQSG